MYFSSALLLAANAAFVLAAPAPASKSIHIGEDDVLLYGDDRVKMMKRSEFDEINAAARNADLDETMPGYLNTELFTLSGSELTKYSPEGVTKRSGRTLFIPFAPKRFLGWDVIMSTVVKGPITISVSSGLFTANSITTSNSASLNIIKDFLTITTSKDYTDTWTTTQTQAFTADIPAGKYGTLVSNAWTNRVSGNMWTGEIGGDGSLVYYQGDSFENKSYSNLNWVNGVVYRCLGDTKPLPRCHGRGTL